MATARSPKRQERGKRRIAHILDVASDVFAEVGYEGATTNAIAARAGMSPGSLYQFFPNKEAIAEALAHTFVEQLAATHDSALDPNVARLPLDALIDRIVDPLIDLYVANPSLKALLYESDISPRLASATQTLHEAVMDRVEAVIAARAPGLRKRELSRAALVSVQIFKAIQPMVLAAAPAERPAVVRELKSALHGYLQTLDAPSTAKRKARR